MRRHVIPVLVGVGAIVMLAACSSGSSGSAGSTADAASSGPQTLTIETPGDFVGWTPVDIAADEGFFKKEGLTVKTVLNGQGAPAALQAVVAGAAQIAQVGAATTAPALAKGIGLQYIAVTTRGYGAQIVFSNKLLAKTGIQPGASTAKVVAALRGARVAVESPGDSPSSLVSYLVKTAGLPASSVTFVPSGDPTGQIAALKAGVVDVLVAGPPYAQQAQGQGLGKVVVRSVPELSQFPYTALSTTKSVLQAHPAAISKLLKGIAMAGCFIKEHPTAAKADMAKRFATMSSSDFEIVWNETAPYFVTNPVMTRAAFSEFSRFESVLGTQLNAAYSDAVPAGSLTSALSGAKVC